MPAIIAIATTKAMTLLTFISRARFFSFKKPLPLYKKSALLSRAYSKTVSSPLELTAYMLPLQLKTAV